MRLLQTIITVLVASLAAPHAHADVKPKGSRALGVHITTNSAVSYDKGITIITALGATVVPLTFTWESIERSAGSFDSTNLAIADAYYPSHGLSLGLSLLVADANGAHLPDDLKGRPLSDRTVCARYRNFVARVLASLSHTTLAYVIVGNEIDLAFGKKEQKWRAFQTILTEGKLAVEWEHRAVPVGYSTTLYGAIGTLKKLNKRYLIRSSALFITYYPIEKDFHVKSTEVVREDIDRVMSNYPHSQLFLIEAGFPTAMRLRSSERSQAEFVHALFLAWDRYRSRMPLMNISWLTDISKSQVNFYLTYYHLHDTDFRSYLSSLGITDKDGTPKQAYQALQTETAARGW